MTLAHREIENTKMAQAFAEGTPLAIKSERLRYLETGKIAKTKELWKCGIGEIDGTDIH
jgi:hypothetical protein